MGEAVHAGDQPTPRIRTTAMRGVLWLGGQRMGSRILDQVFTIILVRLLLPQDFGVVAMASIFTGILSLFANMGVGAAIIQRRDLDDEYLSTAFWVNMTAGLALCALAGASSRLLAAFFKEPLVGPVVLALSLLFVIDAGSSTQAALFSRQMHYRTLTLRSMIATMIGGLVGVGMAYRGMGAWSLVGKMLSGSAASTIALYLATGWRPRFLFSRRKFIDIWSFSAPLLFSRLFGYSIGNSDNLLIGRYLGPAALGFYSRGYSTFLVPLLDIGVPVSHVMFSALSRLQGDLDRLKRGFLLSTRYVSMIVLPMLVGLSLVAPLFVEIVFGAKWLPAAPVMSILALAGCFQLMTSLGHSGLQAVGRTDLQLRWSFLSALVYIPAFGFGLRWGILGVATGYLLATAVLVPVQYQFIARVAKVTVSELWDAVSPGVIGCAVMAAVVVPVMWTLNGTGLAKAAVLALLVALGTVVYAAVIWGVQRQAVLRLRGIVLEALFPPTEPRPREVEGI